MSKVICISTFIMPHTKFQYKCQLPVKDHNLKKHISIVGNNEYRVKASWNVSPVKPIVWIGGVLK